MRYNLLGNTGLFVSEICLGAMTFGENKGMWGAISGVDQQLADEIIGDSIKSGVNFIDTADVYSEGASERIVGQSLKNLSIKRSDVVVATKVYGRTGPGPNDTGASRGHIMDGVEQSLKRLQTDYIDLYQIHATDTLTPAEETLRALDDLVRRGMVRYIGCSNWQAWRIMKALGISQQRGWAAFNTLQAYYSLVGRDLERDIVPLLQDQGIGLLVWSPLAGGLLSGKFTREGEKVEGARRSSFDFPPVDKERLWRCLDVARPIAESHGASVARVVLAWLLSKPFVTSVIIGAKRVDQLQDNLAAAGLQLTTEELGLLDDASTLPPEYPGWMIPFQSRSRRPQSS
ncbi:MAG TPA: aldo/keto reductase [Bryobacteraceae bacterium]|jgi:aryl-alcohol dehydrogenase-like predicted oxidoreductase|nr:aldo/keto reductase [Bryobacteraceae bacterium]